MHFDSFDVRIEIFAIFSGEMLIKSLSLSLFRLLGGQSGSQIPRAIKRVSVIIQVRYGLTLLESY